MERVRQDDLAALAELFDRRQPSLYAFALRLVRNPTVAEDVAQEAFWRVWRSRASFDGRVKFTTWLYVIARRVVVNSWKSGAHGTACFSELSEAEQRQMEASGAKNGSRSPEEVVVAADVRGRVREALQALPPEQNAILILKEYERKSYREIGTIMGCSEGHARVLGHRARAALRTLLRPLMECEEETCSHR
jgi:RNA polymerase sigma-70 factor (ECF subfamily)